MRKSIRIVITCMALVLSLMIGYVFLTMTGLHGRVTGAPLITDMISLTFSSAEENIPLQGRAWIAAVCLAVSFTGITWVMTDKKPRLHWAALALILPVGLMIALCKPALGWTSWDEENHYLVMQGVLGDGGATLTDRVTAMSLWDVGYLPTLVGMAIGHLLGVDDVTSYKLGVTVCVIVYAVMCSLAVKHAPKYKMTFLAVGALPIALFQAASLTYDATVTASVLLAMALLTEEWLTPGRLMGARALTIVALLALGTVSKPVYSLLLLLLLTLPMEKFGDKRRMWVWRAFILLMTVWMLLSLLMPGTYDNVKNGDDRFAGTDSRAQLAFILENPGEALAILGDYIRMNWGGLHWSLLTSWAYVIQTPESFSQILALGILLLCPLCVCGEDERRSPLRISRRTLLLTLEALVLIILIVTQYMVSTPVGSHEIQGMQPRYSLPVWILLALGLMLPDKLRRLLRPVGKPLTILTLAAVTIMIYGFAGYCLFGVFAGMA